MIFVDYILGTMGKGELKVEYTLMSDHGESYTAIGTRNTNYGERKIWRSYSPIQNGMGNMMKLMMLGKLVKIIK